MPLLLLALAGCLADIRPDAVRSATDLDAAAVSGRARLEAAAEAHGGVDAWQARRSVTVVLDDRWRGIYRLASPWPTPDVSVRLEQRIGSFDSRATFLDDENEGLVWGISDWTTWSESPTRGVQVRKHGDTRFMLPTMHYFTEIPYRLLEAPIILDAGDETIRGVAYSRVFVTWESVDANREFDQYVVYIDKQTGRIAKTAYTIRELGGGLVGTMHYEDQVDIDGHWLPMRMVVTGAPDDDTGRYLHRVDVRSWTFDVADPSAFSVPAG